MIGGHGTRLGRREIGSVMCDRWLLPFVLHLLRSEADHSLRIVGSVGAQIETHGDPSSIASCRAQKWGRTLFHGWRGCHRASQWLARTRYEYFLRESSLRAYSGARPLFGDSNISTCPDHLALP
jgi:hypothetical protein